MNDIKELRKEIARDLQIKKFCLYGFLKNLKFFEPYLIIFLMSNQISLFQIGILIAVREVIVNVFEIPSGLIADYFGRKKEMYLCFGFYIVSFVMFFFVENFTIAIFGMIFFGLGEAFRSGTHKAMIYTYLDKQNWQKEKTFVYGRTRSFSLIGSAVSSSLGIAIILIVPADSYIFLCSTIPYILDLILIISYPKYLDSADKNQENNFKKMTKELVNSFRTDKKLRNILIEEGISEASFSYSKDLIQPIFELIIVGSGIAIITSLSYEDNLKIILGLVYAVLSLSGSYFSKKAYLIRDKKSGMECLYIVHIAYVGLYALLAFFSGQYLLVFAIYILIYAVHNIRKPIFVDEIDNNIGKATRATVLSAAAQLKSLTLVIMAPTLGYVADTYGMIWAVLLLSAIFAVTTKLLKANRQV